MSLGAFLDDDNHFFEKRIPPHRKWWTLSRDAASEEEEEAVSEERMNICSVCWENLCVHQRVRSSRNPPPYTNIVMFRWTISTSSRGRVVMILNVDPNDPTE